MRVLLEDILFAVVDWIELHISAWRLGVSAGWLRDRQAHARAFLAQHR